MKRLLASLSFQIGFSPFQPLDVKENNILSTWFKIRPWTKTLKEESKKERKIFFIKN